MSLLGHHTYVWSRSTTTVKDNSVSLELIPSHSANISMYRRKPQWSESRTPNPRLFTTRNYTPKWSCRWAFIALHYGFSQNIFPLFSFALFRIICGEIRLTLQIITIITNYKSRYNYVFYLTWKQCLKFRCVVFSAVEFILA
jgi:hypothetical protein